MIRWEEENDFEENYVDWADAMHDGIDNALRKIEKEQINTHSIMNYEKAWEKLKDFLKDGIDYMNELKEVDRRKSYKVVLNRMKDLEIG